MGMPVKCKVPKAKNNPDFAKGGAKSVSGRRCWIAQQQQLLSEALLALLNQVNTCSMIRISPSFSPVLELRGGGSTKAWLFFSSELRTRAEMEAGVIPPARGYYWNLAKSISPWCWHLPAWSHLQQMRNSLGVPDTSFPFGQIAGEITAQWGSSKGRKPRAIREPFINSRWIPARLHSGLLGSAPSASRWHPEEVQGFDLEIMHINIYTHTYVFYLREDCNHCLIKGEVFKVQKQLCSSDSILKLDVHF